MDNYIILSAEKKGSFSERLCFLYLKLRIHLDLELLSHHRTLQYCKVFLSDSQNQITDLENSIGKFFLIPHAALWSKRHWMAARLPY